MAGNTDIGFWTYKLQDDVRFGNLSLDPTTGVWSYVHTASRRQGRRVRALSGPMPMVGMRGRRS